MFLRIFLSDQMPLFGAVRWGKKNFKFANFFVFFRWFCVKTQETLNALLLLSFPMSLLTFRTASSLSISSRIRFSST